MTLQEKMVVSSRLPGLALFDEERASRAIPSHAPRLLLLGIQQVPRRCDLGELSRSKRPGIEIGEPVRVSRVSMPGRFSRPKRSAIEILDLVHISAVSMAGRFPPPLLFIETFSVAQNPPDRKAGFRV